MTRKILLGAAALLDLIPPDADDYSLRLPLPTAVLPTASDSTGESLKAK